MPTPSPLNLHALALAFLPDGSLVAATETSLVRVDVAGMKVVAQRKASSPSFAVSPRGALFVAEKNKVLACDPAKLTALGPVGMPAGRGRGAVWRELAASPSGDHLAGVTDDGTLHVVHLKTHAVVRASPAYGARRQCIAFPTAGLVSAVREGIVEVEPIDSAQPRQIGVATFGVAADGVFVGWDHTSTLVIVDVASGRSGPLRLPHDDDGCSAALVPGAARAVVSTGGILGLVDLKRRKLLSTVAHASPAALAVSADRLAVSAGGTLEVFALDDVWT